MTRLALLSMLCAALTPGGAWAAGDGGAQKTAAPATPPAFTALTDQPGDTLVTSAIVPMNVFNGAAPVSVSIAGEGSPALRVCADAQCETVLRDWSPERAFVMAGEFIQARLTTAPAGETTYSTTVTVGLTAETWIVTTAPDPCEADKPAPGARCADGSIYDRGAPDANAPLSKGN